MINSLNIHNDYIIEIGFGTGNITAHIFNSNFLSYLGIDIDINFCNYLSNMFILNKSVKFVCSDALKFKYYNLNFKYKMIGNLPFNIVKKFIKHILLDYKNIKNILKCVFIIQKNVADLLLSTLSSKYNYYLGSVLHHFYNVELLTNINGCNFQPNVNVISSVVSFVPKCFQNFNFNINMFIHFIKKIYAINNKKLLHLDDVTKHMLYDYVDLHCRANEISANILLNVFMKYY